MDILGQTIIISLTCKCSISTHLSTKFHFEFCLSIMLVHLTTETNIDLFETVQNYFLLVISKSIGRTHICVKLASIVFCKQNSKRLSSNVCSFGLALDCIFQNIVCFYKSYYSCICCLLTDKTHDDKNPCKFSVNLWRILGGILASCR